ncbi:hypothetical protein [Streptomyces sp. NRRL S-340]|uniref:hypothetical protein n=1 Tax=Streptomyces sp. NRRL S-340 TaxID=1463901 RepID=UPI0007C56A68|nr:hypothetical protein [Streptomyces sp. NRRL S-340]
MPDAPGQASDPDPDSGPPPDIAFRATVRSGRLRFEEAPLTAVRFPGIGPRASLSWCERTNLPDEVVAGEEYRDASVTYRLATRLTGRPEEHRDAEENTDTRTSGRGGGRSDTRTGSRDKNLADTSTGGRSEERTDTRTGGRDGDRAHARPDGRDGEGRTHARPGSARPDHL